MSGSNNLGILIAPPFARAQPGTTTPPTVHNQAMAAIERAFALTNPLGLFFQVGRGTAANPQGLLYVTNLPTSDPGIPGAVWIRNGVLVVSGSASLTSPQKLSFLNFRNPDGSPLTTTQATGFLALAQRGSVPVSTRPVVGSAIVLFSEVANLNGPLTDTATTIFTLPGSYQAGSNFSIIINALSVPSGGGPVISVATVQPFVKMINQDGTIGPNLASAAQSVTNAAANYTFTVTGTGLTAGAQFRLDLQTVITETAGFNAAIRVDSVYVQ